LSSPTIIVGVIKEKYTEYLPVVRFGGPGPSSAEPFLLRISVTVLGPLEILLPRLSTYYFPPENALTRGPLILYFSCFLYSFV